MRNSWKKPVIDAEYVETETVQPVEKVEPDKEILCGVVLTRCPVVSYNKWSNVIVYERDGQLYQTNALDYHGEGYVEVE